MKQVKETTEALVCKQFYPPKIDVEKVKNSLITQPKKPCSDFFIPNFRRYFASLPKVELYNVNPVQIRAWDS